jgi:hypothetical protein
MLEWMAAPRHRDPVFERDGWTCAVPGFRSRRNLHDHHVTFRSQGSDNARDDRNTVCAAHHLHGIHRGHIRASGRAPHAIQWEIGCRFGVHAGGALALLVGDRYIDRDGFVASGDTRRRDGSGGLHDERLHRQPKHPTKQWPTGAQMEKGCGVNTRSPRAPALPSLHERPKHAPGPRRKRRRPPPDGFRRRPSSSRTPRGRSAQRLYFSSMLNRKECFFP